MLQSFGQLQDAVNLPRENGSVFISIYTTSLYLLCTPRCVTSSLYSSTQCTRHMTHCCSFTRYFCLVSVWSFSTRLGSSSTLRVKLFRTAFYRHHLARSVARVYQPSSIAVVKFRDIRAQSIYKCGELIGNFLTPRPGRAQTRARGGEQLDNFSVPDFHRVGYGNMAYYCIGNGTATIGGGSLGRTEQMPSLKLLCLDLCAR